MPQARKYFKRQNRLVVTTKRLPRVFVQRCMECNANFRTNEPHVLTFPHLCRECATRTVAVYD